MDEACQGRCRQVGEKRIRREQEFRQLRNAMFPTIHEFPQPVGAIATRRNDFRRQPVHPLRYAHTGT